MVDPITAAAVTTYVAGGIVDGLNAINRKSLINERGELYNSYYQNRLYDSLLADQRTATRQVGKESVSASARGIDFSGSALGAAMDNVFDIKYKGASERNMIRTQANINMINTQLEENKASEAATSAAIRSVTNITDLGLTGGVKK